MDSTEQAIVTIVIAVCMIGAFAMYQENETKRECIRTPGCVWQK